MDTLIGIITNNAENPSALYVVAILGLLATTFGIIWTLKGRTWAVIYVLIIPFLNWSFSVIPQFQVVAPEVWNAQGIALHPMTIVTGLVFVIRDFAQREMGHRVLIVMAMAIGWSFFYAWPVIALASGIAFAISESVDWLLFTFTKYRLSTRILLSSAVAAPLDTTVFLYGADLAQQMALGLPAGNMLHLANWIVFVIGKMVGAFVISAMIRQREKLGEYADVKTA
ncbi:MAG: hypothetical protein AAFX02_05220 [Pseudomonadota bacterium]